MRSAECGMKNLSSVKVMLNAECGMRNATPQEMASTFYFEVRPVFSLSRMREREKTQKSWPIGLSCDWCTPGRSYGKSDSNSDSVFNSAFRIPHSALEKVAP